MQEENIDKEFEASLPDRIEVLEKVQDGDLCLADKMKDRDYLGMIIFSVFCLVLVIIGGFV